MPTIYLGLGSNIEPRRYLTAGLDMLNAELGELRLSPVYESSAVGFAGDPFWNMVAGVQSDIELGRLIKTLKFIEDSNGRDRSGPKFGPRTLDVDILTYDDLVGEQQGVWLPRDEITEQTYVLRPLAEIAGDQLLPGANQTYAQLWEAFDQLGQPLARIGFEWRGRQISEATTL